MVMTNLNFIVFVIYIFNRKNNKINKGGRKNIEQTSADSFGDQQPDICLVETGTCTVVEISVQILTIHCIHHKGDSFYDL